MVRGWRNSIPTILALYQIFCKVSTQQCREEYSIYGMMLRRHSFKSTMASNWNGCIQACNDDVRCQSMNYDIGRQICELNDRTKEAKPEDFVADKYRSYVKRLKRGITHFSSQLARSSIGCNKTKTASITVSNQTEEWTNQNSNQLHVTVTVNYSKWWLNIKVIFADILLEIRPVIEEISDSKKGRWKFSVFEKKVLNSRMLQVVTWSPKFYFQCLCLNRFSPPPSPSVEFRQSPLTGKRSGGARNLD